MALFKNKENGAYSRQGDRIKIHKGANEKVILNALDRINPAKDTLDVALMNKYPTLDLDKLKREASNIKNTDLFGFIKESSPADQSLSKAEMKKALGDKGYEDYMQNTKLVQSMYGMDVSGTEEPLTKDRKRMYGKRSSLFKYYTPVVEGEPKPYRYSEELSKIDLRAEGGGLSRKKDRGSEKKPYPGVAKGDFAGGSRSYPIPTKADAADALRLAGMHGRADVRAKVFKKYPSLKK